MQPRGPLLGALIVLATMLAWLLWPSRVGDAVRTDAHAAREGEQPSSRPATTATPTMLAREKITTSTAHSRPASARSAGVRGRVVERGAGPIARAALRLTWVVSPKQETRDARCDADGRFEVEGLPVRKLVVVAFADGFARRALEVETRAGEWVEVEVELARGWTVLGRVRDAAGAPLERVSIQVEGRVLGTRSGAMTDADGAFRVDGATAPPELLRVVQKGYFERRVRLGWPDPTTRVQTCEVVLSALPPVSGRLLDERGRALPGWLVYADSKLPYGAFTQGKTDAEGRFVLRLDEGRRYRIALIEKEGIAGFSCDWVGETQVGAPELTITVPDRVRPSAFVRGVLADAGGEPLAKAMFTLCLACGSKLRELPTDAKGAFRLGPLPPQKVRMLVRRAGPPWPLIDLGEVDLAPEQELDLGLVRLPRFGTLSVLAREGDGLAVKEASIQVDHENGEHAALADLRDGRAKLELPPGSYTVGTGGRYVPQRRQHVKVDGGQVVDLELTMTRGMRQELAIEIPQAESAGRRCQLTLHRPDGSSEQSAFDPEVGADLPTRHVFFVARGEHRVEIVTDAGKRFAATFTIASLEKPAEWLLLRAEPR